MKTERESLKRRTWLGGAVSAGAAVAGTVLTSRSLVSQGPVQPGEASSPVPAPGTGYQLTEHVRRYYATAKV